jgi:hypothetical protein
MKESWVIAGEPKEAVPQIGQEYEVRDSRKGTFRAKVLEVDGIMAAVEVTDGAPRFASLGARLEYEGRLTIRAGMVYLIPLAEQKG